MSEGLPGPGDVAAGFGPGSRVAGYLLEEQIGAGGMAVVFRAHDMRLDRTVALKILAPGLAADEAFRQRFVRESRAAAAVDDPHIIPVFEAGESQGVLFIAMRFVRGGDARSLVARSGRLPPARAVEVVSQVARALDAAHGRGLVHRDVKPANMLLDAGGGEGRPEHVYLSDFGLSKGSLQQSGLTGTGTFLGTLDYVAPEQIEGRPVDGRADEYALACAAFELLSGSPPFARPEAMAVMYAQLNEPPPALSGRAPGLPGAADAVFARGLAKAPADRYGSCQEFAEALRHALGLTPYDSGPSRVHVAEHAPTEAIWAAEATGPAAEVTTGMGAEPTRAVGATGGPGGSGRGHTAPDLTPAYGYGQTAQDTGQLPPRRRSRGLFIGAVVVLLAAGGGAYAAFGRNGGRGPGGGHPVTVLALPGCTTAAAKATPLAVARGFTATNGGSPFGVVASADGKYVFAIMPTTLQVLKVGPGLALTPTVAYTIATAPFVAADVTLTPDGQHLLVAVGNGILVLSVASMESGVGGITGTLTVPGVSGYGRALDIATSPDGKFAFVTMQFRHLLAVFNLGQALATGSFGSAFVGQVDVGDQPVGVTASPDGKTLYVASLGTGTPNPANRGQLTVLDMAKAKTDPARSVLAQVPAGCAPARVVVSGDSKVVWVTARGSNALLGFNAARLRSDPRKALAARVMVGQTPIGLALVPGGNRMIVADTNTAGVGGADTLAVVNVAKALAGGASLLGYIPTGALPREFALVPHTPYLVVSDNGSSQLQLIDLQKLP